MHSLLGLAALNGLLLATGFGLLWGARGWRSWGEMAQLAGLAYFLGVGAVIPTVSVALTAGGGASLSVVVAVAVGLGTAGIALGMVLRRPRPVLTRGDGAPEPWLLAGVLPAALSLVLLACIFRLARLQGTAAWDGWTFWVPKAQTIYYFGLDPKLLATFAGPTYPIFVPTMQAVAFRFMGSADTIAIHVQYWLLLVGFVFAVVSLLRPYVSLALLWPFLALALVMPGLGERALAEQADLPLDYFFAAAALTVALWLLRRADWLLLPYGVTLAAVLTMKQEGQLLAAVLVVSGLVVSIHAWKSAWPRLVGVAALAYLFDVPWRIWLTRHHIGGEWGAASLHGMLAHVARIPPAIGVTAGLLFDYHLWLVVVPLALLAAVAVLLVRRSEPVALLYLVTLVLGFAGMVWVYWAFTDFPVDTSDQSPVPRVIGALILLSASFTPLMLARLLEREPAGG